MTLTIRPAIAQLPMSATLQANQAAAERRRAGREVLHIRSGQAPFPVHPLLAAALGTNAGANLYEHVAGVAGLRASVLQQRYDVLALPGTGFGAAPEQLCLRLSVTEYDGALALEVCEGVADPAGVIDQFAPRVVAATQALREFSSGAIPAIHS